MKRGYEGVKKVYMPWSDRDVVIHNAMLERPVLVGLRVFAIEYGLVVQCWKYCHCLQRYVLSSGDTE
jgi:hypothetical protein